MPQSFTAIYIHAVFSTSGRRPFLSNTEKRENLHAYLIGISKNLQCPTLAVGGTADHVHLLAQFGKTIGVSDWIKELKRASSLHAKRSPIAIDEFSWQAGEPPSLFPRMQFPQCGPTS